MERYTEQSKANLEKLGRGMSSKEIMEFLEKGVRPRTFSEVLGEIYQKDDLKERISRELIAMERPEKKKEAIDYKISRWLNKDSIPNRKDLDKICEILGAGEEDKEKILLELEAEPKRIGAILREVYIRDNLEERIRNRFSEKDKRRYEVKKILDTEAQYCLDGHGQIIPEWEAVISDFCDCLNLDDGKKRQVFGEIKASRRRFLFILKSICPDEDLQKRLQHGLYELEIPKTWDNPEKSINHSVNDWFHDKHAPNRENLFKICYALGLDYSKSEEVISALGTPVHHRNPDDLIFAYGLWNGLSWGEVQILKEELAEKNVPAMRRQLIKEYKARVKQLKGIPHKEGEIDAYNEKIRQLELELEKNRENIVYSEIIREEFFQSVDDEIKFIKFYEKRCSEFDTFHETSYREFKQMMDLLQRKYNRENKKKGQDGATKMSDAVEAVVEQYFNVPLPAKHLPMMNAIRKNFPTVNKLRAIVRREQDVTREVLIMLSLALDIFEDCSLNQEWLAALPEQTPYERMMSRMEQLNQLLDKCGMSGLNPGNPFDCLMLYAMTASYDCFEETMNDKIKELMEECQ